ncbi:MAG: mandelate racemase/muconate lactonizing enzyme family protein [Chloroflexota bacterium]|nr:mandelate racemase/muconate lactonizing enzyme family protein [Dehalococcoidia bacterium]MDW8254025.1 mandelate racemase/muconate lactonizing enzyme family protein [Chloroflexota bacterium]
MIIDRLRATHVRVPLRRPFVTAREVLRARDIWIVRLDSREGLTGTGEAAPLLGHGLAAGPPVARLLDAVRQALPAALDCLPLPRGTTATEAAVRFALETAQLDLQGQLTGRSLAELLGKKRQAFPVNAVLGAAADDEVVAEATAAVAAGFGTIKVKVGGRPLADDLRRLERIRAAVGPTVRLRIDANGAWDASAALAALRAFRPLGLELVEQPVAPGQPALLRRLREQSEVPIAADEDVASLEAAGQLLAADAVDLLVLKPMILGGLRAALDLAVRAFDRGVRCFVTTTIESGIATAAAAQLAAALPGAVPACGLATGPLLASDLLAQPLPLCRGTMYLPGGHGLGAPLDERELARFAVRESLEE